MAFPKLYGSQLSTDLGSICCLLKSTGRFTWRSTGFISSHVRWKQVLKVLIKLHNKTWDLLFRKQNTQFTPPPSSPQCDTNIWNIIICYQQQKNYQEQIILSFSDWRLSNSATTGCPLLPCHFKFNRLWFRAKRLALHRWKHLEEQPACVGFQASCSLTTPACGRKLRPVIGVSEFLCSVSHSHYYKWSYKGERG